MATAKWCQASRWTDAERAKFDEQIVLVSDPMERWKAFNTQATLLFLRSPALDAREEALRLLQRSIDECEGAPAACVALSLATIGEYKAKLGSLDEAEAHLLDARARCEKSPKTRHIHDQIARTLKAVREQKKKRAAE